VSQIPRRARDVFSRWRRRLIRRAYSWPPFAARDPARRLITCRQHFTRVDSLPRPEQRKQQEWYLPVRPPEVVQRAEPASLDAAQAARFEVAVAHYQNGRRCELPGTFLAGLPAARVWGPNFVVLSRDRRILFDSLLQRRDLLEASGLLERLRWPRARQWHGTACLLAQDSPHAYYHWLLEMLPKLALIEQFPELAGVPLLVPERLSSFQRDSLRLAGVVPERLLGFDGGCAEFEQLYVPSLPAPTGWPAPHAVQWLRDRFLAHGAVSRRVGRRLFLSRRDALQRRVLNEDELVAWLQQQGFEVLCPAELTFTEQIGVFRDVEVVVAAHGAAVSNMVFAPAGAVLIELFGDNYINGCFWALAAICGHHYGFVTGPARGLDYSIPLSALQRMVERMLSSLAPRLPLVCS
jgi:hypothetical protein